MNLDVLCKLMHTVCVGVCVRACACLGSIPHRLCLTGCPCRVNKTNLRSGLALGRGCWGYWGCLQEWRAYQEWRTHTYAHTLILKHLLLLPTLSFHYYTSGAPDVDKQSTCTLGRPPPYFNMTLPEGTKSFLRAVLCRSKCGWRTAS